MADAQFCKNPQEILRAVGLRLFVSGSRLVGRVHHQRHANGTSRSRSKGTQNTTPCRDFVVRPHRTTTDVDAACCYRPSSVVCRSVCRSVCHTSEPCKNGCTDRVAVWDEGWGETKEPCIRWGPDPPWEGATLRGKGRPIVKYRDTLRSPMQNG